MTTIVLAAGCSTRMGENKLLLRYNGKTVIEHVVETAILSSNRVIVVTGFEEEKIKKALEAYNVEIVFNKDYEHGQKSSCLAGLEKVEDDSFSIIPGDLALIEKSDLDSTFALLDSFDISRAYYKTIPGHPVAYRKENRDSLLAFPGSMKEYLSTKSVGIAECSIGSVYDIDTPERYKNLLLGNHNMIF